MANGTDTRLPVQFDSEASMSLEQGAMHPSDEVLSRFAAVETSRQESQVVVRHLLHGCGECGGKVKAALSPRGREGDCEAAFQRLRMHQGARVVLPFAKRYGAAAR
jgi:hypothetical protein